MRNLILLCEGNMPDSRSSTTNTRQLRNRVSPGSRLSHNTSPSGPTWNVECDCGFRAARMTTWKLANAGRRFYTCHNWMNEEIRCRFFQWLDDDYTDRAKYLIHMLKKDCDELRHGSKVRRTREHTEDVDARNDHREVIKDDHCGESVVEQNACNNIVSSSKTTA